MDIKYSYYVSSKGFKVVGGTAAQFLKADGSVDNNSYVTINTAQNIIAQKTFTQSPVIPDGTVGNHAVTVYQLNKYLPLTGGTIVGNINLQLQNAKVGIGKMNETGDVHVGSSGMTIPSTVISDYGFYLSYNAYRDIDGEWKHSRTTSVNAYVFKGGHHNAGFSWSVSPNVGTANLNLTEIMKLDNVGNLKANSFSIAGGTNAQFLKANGSIDSNSYLTVNQTDAKYIPLSQRGTANGVATLDASVQIPNAQIPQRLLNKVIALGGEGSVDTSFTGLYDRNQLTLADKEHTVTTVLNGAGSFGNPLSTFNSIIFNAKSDFAIINGADSTTELVITINLNSVLNNYSRGYWQAFVQSRLQNTQMFRDISVEVMDNNNVWFPALTATNVVQIPGSGLYLFPESTFGTASIKSIRFKLSNVLTFNGIVYVSNIGFRHNAHSFAPQFPHRGENNKFFGVNDFSLSPTVPTATVANQAVNFGQIVGKVNQSDLNTQLANYATLNGVQTFTNTKTFLQSPVVPDATLLPHAVNFGQMSNAIEESEGNTVGYVSNNYVNTPDGFAVLLSDDTDLNANLKTGFYRGKQLVHAPDNNVGWWFITVETHDNTWVTQKAVSFGAANVGGLIYQRNLSWDGWSDWEQVWTSKQFSQTNINKWDAAIEKNVVFSTDSTLALMISDGSFNGEAGLVDSDNEVIIAGEENGYWKFATNIGDTGGILVDKNTRRMSYGNVLPSGSYKHNFGGTIFINDNITSAGGFIHNDYNDPNKILTSDGGVIDINSFGGTTVKYTEVNSGDSFTPSPDYIHHNVLARGGMKLRLDTGSGSVNGQVITLFHNTSSITQVWKDGAVVATISGAKTTKFIKTSLGWQMTDVGTSTFI